MASIPFDRYLRYAEIESILDSLVEEFPGFVEKSSIGKSFEGRDIWLMTLTNTATGPANEKPAFWVDGNIHATELSASSASLMVIAKLLGVHTGGEVSPLLDNHAVYVVPRLNPDGAEWALENPPRLIRSSTRPYPYDEDDAYGLEVKDIDGDGKILTMRVPDPNGVWKVSDLDPRLMKRREPGETGGTYYRMVPEGEIHNYDGISLRPRARKEGLDLNRNYPNGWRMESEQHGAGDFPASEPEVRAAIEAIVARPNICGGVAFHTFSGVNLRPSSTKADSDLPAEDVWTYTTIGDKGKEMSGYPALSVFHDFKYHPKEVITGAGDDWLYEMRGVYSWTTEIWSPQRQSGITDYKYIDWFREHPHEDDLKILKWSDEKLGGKGHVDWRSYDHPQLGAVEIGGWDFMHAFRNPPGEYLEAEIAPLADWVIWQVGLAPCLTVRKIVTEPVGESAWRIRFAVQNTGWLPTTVTKVAAEKKMCRGVIGEIECEGVADTSYLASGKVKEQGPQLVGWSHVTSSGFGGGFEPTEDIHVFDWVVNRPGKYRLLARHDRAGTIRAEVEVG